MNIKIVKALSRHGYIHSKTHLFPDYIVESGVTQPGIKKMLDDLEIPWEEFDDITERNTRGAQPGNPRAKYAPIVADFNSRLRDAMSSAIQGDDDLPIMIGGDHSSSIGSVAGVLAKRPNLGVLWIDAHSDCHTPESTETGWVYGMPVAVACGHGDPALLEVMQNNYIDPKNFCLFGVRYMEPGEVANLREWGVTVITMDDIDEKGIYPCFHRAMETVTQNTDHLHVSLDIDVIDKLYAPGATEPTQGGLTFREINFIARRLGRSQKVGSIDLVEGEPDKDNNYMTGKLCLQVLANMLGRKYSEYAMYLASNRI